MWFAASSEVRQSARGRALVVASALVVAVLCVCAGAFAQGSKPKAPTQQQKAPEVVYKGTFSGEARGKLVMFISGATAKGYVTGKHGPGEGEDVKLHFGGKLDPKTGALKADITGNVDAVIVGGKRAKVPIKGTMTGKLTGDTVTGTWQATAGGPVGKKAKGTFKAKRTAQAPKPQAPAKRATGQTKR